MRTTSLRPPRCFRPWALTLVRVWSAAWTMCTVCWRGSRVRSTSDPGRRQPPPVRGESGGARTSACARVAGFPAQRNGASGTAVALVARVRAVGEQSASDETACAGRDGMAASRAVALGGLGVGPAADDAACGDSRLFVRTLGDDIAARARCAPCGPRD